MADRPDPNGGMESYKRNHAPEVAGTHGLATATANPMNDPRRPMSMTMLDEAANATDQAYAAQYNDANAAFTKFADTPGLDRGGRNGTGEGRGVVGRTDITQATQQGLDQQNRMRQSQVAIMNPEGRRYTQALKNAGVDRANTNVMHEAGPYEGSSFGIENTDNSPTREQGGFFNTQDHNNLQRQSLQYLLRANDYNNGRGF